MSTQVARYQCPDCGQRIDFNWRGTPRDWVLICVECDTGMQQVTEDADGGSQ